MENPVSFDKVQRDVESRPRGAGDRLGRILDLQEQAFADRAVRIKRLSNDFDRLLLDISAVLNR